MTYQEDSNKTRWQKHNTCTYKTVHIWSEDKKHLVTFYKYNMNIRYIPTGISFTHRNKEYSTVNLMEAINCLCRNRVKLTWNFPPETWYNLRTGQLHKSDFIKAYDLIMKTSKSYKN